jgi:uncharacterized protein (TIGR02996 family)
MPPTTHDLAFLEDIALHPNDDTPRLIYADWLEDRAEPDDADRAEFIRVQIELANLPDGQPRRRAELTRREQALLRAHVSAWWGELPEWARQQSVLGAANSFRRGFVVEVTARARDFVRGAGDLLRRFPVQSLQLSQGEHHLGALAACPHLARLGCLGGRTALPLAALHVLLASPYLGNLTLLELSDSHVGDRGARILAGSPNLPNLRELDLEYNDIGDAGAGALADSPHLAGLTRLALSGNHIGEDGALALAQSPHLGRLDFLDLTVNPIGTEGRRALRQRFGARVLVPGR